MKKIYDALRNCLTNVQQYLLSGACLIFYAMLITGILGKCFNDILYLVFIIIFCFIDVVVFGVLLVLLMPKTLKNSKEDNRINICILAVIMILLCICISVLLDGISALFSDEVKVNLFSSATDIIKVLIPSILSLLGLHYSNILNQQNLNEERRLQNRPYLKIRTGRQNEYTVFRIKNISNTICVPIKVELDDGFSAEFDYNPIIFDKEESFNIKKEFSPNDKIKIIFKDTLENFYYLTFNYNPNITEMYVVTSEPKLIDTEKL